MSYIFEGPWRLFLHSVVSIREQMARDEALLRNVDENGPVLCFYDIHPVAVSLGAFQKVEAAFDPDKFKPYAMGFVRRPTGGQALFHKHAIVFSVIIGRRHFVPFRKKEIYLALAPFFVMALKDLGIPARIHFKEDKDAIRPVVPHPHCFAGPGEYEVVSSAGRKLVGSAQVITREGCLQQNFIPLDDSYLELETMLCAGTAFPPGGSTAHPDYNHAEAASLSAAAGQPVSFLQVQTALLASFRNQYTLKEDSFTNAEQELMQRLLAGKYNQQQWNYRY